MSNWCRSGRHLQPCRTCCGAPQQGLLTGALVGRCRLGQECSRTEVEDVEVRVIHQIEFITHALLWRWAAETKVGHSVLKCFYTAVGPWAPQGLSSSRPLPGLPAPCRVPPIPPVPLLPPRAPKATPLPAPCRAYNAAQSQGQITSPPWQPE